MKHIMVIDDSPTMRTSIEYTIKSLGFTITQAENGSVALEQIKGIQSSGEDIALCISDVNMPVMDGITFIKEFRKIDRFTPVLVLTTESEDNVINRGKEAGASGWLIKPFQPSELIETVGKFVR